jgi:hypothetical protein
VANPLVPRHIFIQQPALYGARFVSSAVDSNAVRAKNPSGLSSFAVITNPRRDTPVAVAELLTALTLPKSAVNQIARRRSEKGTGLHTCIPMSPVEKYALVATAELNDRCGPLLPAGSAENISLRASHRYLTQNFAPPLFALLVILDCQDT